jgi:hypothetical protein
MGRGMLPSESPVIKTIKLEEHQSMAQIRRERRENSPFLAPADAAKQNAPAPVFAMAADVGRHALAISDIGVRSGSMPSGEVTVS